MEDLPCDLDCRNDRGKTLVEEYDILTPITPLGGDVTLITLRCLPRRYEQRQMHPGRLYHSRPISCLINENTGENGQG